MSSPVPYFPPFPFFFSFLTFCSFFMKEALQEREACSTSKTPLLFKLVIECVKSYSEMCLETSP